MKYLLEGPQADVVLQENRNRIAMGMVKITPVADEVVEPAEEAPVVEPEDKEQHVEEAPVVEPEAPVAPEAPEVPEVDSKDAPVEEDTKEEHEGDSKEVAENADSKEAPVEEDAKEAAPKKSTKAKK